MNEEPADQPSNSSVSSEPAACPVDRDAVDVSIMSDESNGLPVDTEDLEDELLSDVDDSGSESDLSDADADDGVHAVQVDDSEDVVVDEEEVVVGINEQGELVVRSSRVSDYIMRGPALEDISLWEYTTWVRKEWVSKLTRVSSGYDDSDESGSEDEGTDGASSNLLLESIADGDWSSVGAMLEDRRRKQPKFRFADGHTDCRYYYQHISHPHITKTWAMRSWTDCYHHPRSSCSDLIWAIFTDLGHWQQATQTFDLHVVGSGCGQSPIRGRLWSSACSPTISFDIVRVIWSRKKGLTQTGTDSSLE